MLYLFLLAIVILAMVGINELGYEVFGLLLLPLAYLLMKKVFGGEKP